jgi:hypothetical protein
MCTPVYDLEEGTMGQIGTPLVGSYDLRLVALAFPSAILASHVALDLSVPRNGPREEEFVDCQTSREVINMKIRNVILAILLGIGVIAVFLLVTAAIASALGSYPKREFGR